jgi:hypothetical protein
MQSDTKVSERNTSLTLHSFSGESVATCLVMDRLFWASGVTWGIGVLLELKKASTYMSVMIAVSAIMSVFTVLREIGKVMFSLETMYDLIGTFSSIQVSQSKVTVMWLLTLL